MLTRSRVKVSLALGAALCSCGLETGDLDAFRDTASGPEKLRAVLGDDSRPAPLRAEAALRLLDLERRDVDGRALLFEALTTLTPVSREALVPTFERGLGDRLATPEGRPPSPRAIRAKDVGVRLLPLLDPPARARLGARLLRWMSADPEHRADAGVFSPERLAAQLGSASADPTSEGLRPAISPQALGRLLNLVAAHADERMREQAAQRLVAVEQSYRREPAHASDVVTHALPALGRFVDTDAARTRLVAVATDASLLPSERALALRLLAGRATRADLRALSGLCLDEGAPPELRELALARIGETRAREALPTLLALATTRASRALRQLAAELTIEIGGERSLAPLMRALPSHWNVAYARDELDAYAKRVQDLRPTGYLTALLGKRLYGTLWWNRVLAIRYFAQAQDQVDATRRLRQLADDTQEIVGDGWPDKWTVGREAQLALRALAGR